jgi:DNA invertase Pin-like site-specific DNA recombinase
MKTPIATATAAIIAWAIAYFRFSDKSQSIGHSEMRQEGQFAEFLTRSGLTPGETYFDRGESAYHGNHRSAEFGRLLADCEARKFPQGSVIWFEDMDRFGRGKLYTVLGDWDTITSNGYGIHIASLGTTYTSETPEMELIAVIMKAILAHDESEKKSMRGKKNRAEIRKTGRTIRSKRRLAACPFWLSVGTDGEYHENDYAPLVREAFRLAKSGECSGCAEIKARLGHPTRPITRRNRKGEKTTVEAAIDVRGLLRNRACIGEFQAYQRVGKSARKATGEVKTGHYPAVVNEDTFFKVQTGLNSRRTQRGRKGKGVSNLFTELIHDARDKEAMHLKIEADGQHTIRRKTAGPLRSWDYAQVERTLLGLLVEVQLTPVSAVGEDWQARLDDIDGRIGKTSAMLVENPSDAGFAVLAQLEAKRREIVIKQEEDKGKTAAPEILTTARNVIAEMSKATGDELTTLRTRVKGLVRQIVSEVWLVVFEYGGVRYCEVQAYLRNGQRRRVMLDKGGVYNDTCLPDSAKAGQDLREYAGWYDSKKARQTA